MNDKPHNSENCKNLKCDLNAISEHIKKQSSCVVFTTVLILVLLTGIYIICNCCKKTDLNNNSKRNTDMAQIESTIAGEDRNAPQNDNQYSKCQKKSKQTTKPKNVDQSINTITAALNTKVIDSSLDLSIKAHQNLNTRSDCFWFIILYITALCLILIFYLIHCSSREDKWLQFIIDLSDQEKEIQLKKIEKEIRLRE